MKKIIATVLGLLLVFCVACGEDDTLPKGVTCEQILEVATDVKSYKNTQEYIKNKSDLDAYTMSMWADGLFEECEEYDLLLDYAICYSKDNTTYEISVLKAKSEDAVTELKALLERRKTTLEGGTKAAYDPNFKGLMQSSKIKVYGEYVVLLITDDNDAIIKAIDGLK